MSFVVEVDYGKFGEVCFYFPVFFELIECLYLLNDSIIMIPGFSRLCYYLGDIICIDYIFVCGGVGGR